LHAIHERDLRAGTPRRDARVSVASVQHPAAGRAELSRSVSSSNATAIFAGLRISELISLRWRSVDLARGRLTVESSKTDAGLRSIDLSPSLLDELKLHRARARFDGPNDIVFCTAKGTARLRGNITKRILRPAIAASNEAREKAGQPPLPENITNHSLRRTFASLKYEVGSSPVEVMAEMGHTSPSLALSIYTKKLKISRDTGAKMDALVWPNRNGNGDFAAELDKAAVRR
jgi:integrase